MRSQHLQAKKSKAKTLVTFDTLSLVEYAVALALVGDERRETSYVTSGDSPLPHVAKFAVTHDELRERTLSVEILGMRSTNGVLRRIGIAQLPLQGLGE